MAKKNVHVVPTNKGWAVKKVGNTKASSTHPTQKDAIKAGTQAAKNEQSELLIHGKDGKIREKNSHGNDPYPPKG